MKSIAVFALALVCVFGVALGQLGLGAGIAATGGTGLGPIFSLLALLLFLLFSNRSSGSGSTTIIYGNFSK